MSGTASIVRAVRKSVMNGKAQKRYRAAKVLTAIPLIVFAAAMLCFIAAGSLPDPFRYRNDTYAFGEKRAGPCTHRNIYSGADRNYFFAVLHRSGSYCDLLYRTGRLGSVIGCLMFDEECGQVFFINKGKICEKLLLVNN